MDPATETIAEETLDPADWAALRRLGHQMLDEMLTYLETVGERPAWRPIPDEVKRHLSEALPTEPQRPEEIYAEFVETILPYPTGNIHPRFWGWVNGTGTPLGMLAEMLAAGMNSNVFGGEQVANYVESQVLDWCKAFVGYPAEAGGLLVSGGSMANLTALTVARNTRADFDLRLRGLHASPQPLTVYGSSEMHSSIQKAIELLGLGSEALRQIPVNRDYQIDLGALEAAIARDRAAGYRPICVVGCAGTVNTGAFDDLNALAEICAREGLWFHVDGAFGALAALAPGLRHLVAGVERADSVAMDLHKWLYIPIDVGCVLVRREEDHRRAFSLRPEYLRGGERGLDGGSFWPSDYGVELTRPFRALKVWFSLKAYGSAQYGRLIQQNVEQARHLAALVDRAPELERLAPVPLNIVCFRFNPGDLEEAALNQLNRNVLAALHESGLAVPSATTLDGRYAIRVAITNHRSRREDFDLLAREVVRIGTEEARSAERGIISDER